MYVPSRDNFATRSLQAEAQIYDFASKGSEVRHQLDQRGTELQKTKKRLRKNYGDYLFP